MKSMQVPSVAIFFMTYFYRAGGPWPPRPPLDPLLILTRFLTKKLNARMRMLEYFL